MTPNMSNTFFVELRIPKPKYNLHISGLSHGSMVAKMLGKIEKIFDKEEPKAVVVFGDTNSTLAGALASSKLNIPIFHIEAGLRSFNRKQPEEQNRKLTDHLSDVCIAPTDIAVGNLYEEGIEKSRIFKTGDIMADSARLFGNEFEGKSEFLRGSGLSDKPFILATIHRQENTDCPQRLKNIFEVLNELTKFHEPNTNNLLSILVSLHPRTKDSWYGLSYLLDSLIVSDPLGLRIYVKLKKS